MKARESTRRKARRDDALSHLSAGWVYTALGGAGLIGGGWVMGFRTFVVGRGGGADLRYDDPAVSRRHLEVTLTGDGRLYLIDAASRAGTRVRRGGEWRALAQGFVEPGDRLLLGNTQVPVAELQERIQTLARGMERKASRGDSNRNASPSA